MLDLGQAKKITIDKDNTTIIEGKGKHADVESRVKEIRGQIDKTTSDYDREKLEARLAKLVKAGVLDPTKVVRTALTNAGSIVAIAKRNSGSMNTGSSESLNSRTWRELYKAVLFEVDKTKLPERIAQAEKAMALKARELFYVAGDSIEEGQSLDDAVYALRTLRNTSQTNHSTPPVVAVV